MKNKMKPRYDSRSERGNNYCNDLHPFVKCKSTAYSPKNQVLKVTADLRFAHLNLKSIGGDHE